MRFFFDRNMPPQLARMVEALEREHTARSYYDDDRFTDTTPDVDWIKALAADDPPWIIISGDGRILSSRRGSARRYADHESGKSSVFLRADLRPKTLHGMVRSEKKTSAR